MNRLSKGKSVAVLIFALAVLIAVVIVVNVSAHRMLWLLGLAASIPLFAAIVGGFRQGDKGGHS